MGYEKGGRETKSMTMPKLLASGSGWSNISQEKPKKRREGGS